MQKAARTALLCSLLLASTASLAASPMKPGLWDVTVQSDALKQAPQLTPEQIAQMRKMGITVPEFKNGGMSTKVCYTKAMLGSDAVPGQQSRECIAQNMKYEGDRFSADYVCDGHNMTGTGKASGTMTETRFEAHTSFSGTAGGFPVNQRSTVSGNFIGDNCGNVKPLGTR